MENYVMRGYDRVKYNSSTSTFIHRHVNQWYNNHGAGLNKIDSSYRYQMKLVVI